MKVSGYYDLICMIFRTTCILWNEQWLHRAVKVNTATQRDKMTHAKLICIIPYISLVMSWIHNYTEASFQQLYRRKCWPVHHCHPEWNSEKLLDGLLWNLEVISMRLKLWILPTVFILKLTFCKSSKLPDHLFGSESCKSRGKLNFMFLKFQRWCVFVVFLLFCYNFNPNSLCVA